MSGKANRTESIQMKNERPERRRGTVIKAMPVFVILILFVISFQGAFSEDKIDDIVHRHDGEDRYAGEDAWKSSWII